VTSKHNIPGNNNNWNYEEELNLKKIQEKNTKFHQPTEEAYPAHHLKLLIKNI